MGNPNTGEIYELPEGVIPERGHVGLSDLKAKQLLAMEVEKRKEELQTLAAERASGLSFAEVSRVNLERALVWHKGGLEEWSVSDWAVAVMGEAGEICDAIKKLRRVEEGVESKSKRQPLTREEALKAIETEIGDTAVYLDLLAQRLGLSLEDCIRNTFNRISEREGLPQRL